LLRHPFAIGRERDFALEIMPDRDKHYSPLASERELAVGHGR
jgi:hypothetical protein